MNLIFTFAHALAQMEDTTTPFRWWTPYAWERLHPEQDLTDDEYFSHIIWG